MSMKRDVLGFNHTRSRCCASSSKLQYLHQVDIGTWSAGGALVDGVGSAAEVDLGCSLVVGFALSPLAADFRGAIRNVSSSATARLHKKQRRAIGEALCSCVDKLLHRS